MRLTAAALILATVGLLLVQQWQSDVGPSAQQQFASPSDRACAHIEASLPDSRPVPRGHQGTAEWLKPFPSLLSQAAARVQEGARDQTHPALIKYVRSIRRSSRLVAQLSVTLQRTDARRREALALRRRLAREAASQRDAAEQYGLHRCREGAGVTVLFKRLGELPLPAAER